MYLFVLVVVLGLGILLLPESISSSLNYSLDSLSSPSSSSSSNSTSSPTSHPSSYAENGDLTLQEGGMTESYSSGAAGGYAFTKPFNMSYFGTYIQMSYIGSDGYLYTGGYNWGGSSNTTNTSWYKQTNAGTNIVDHDISNSYGLIVNSTGEVKIGAKNTNTTTAWSTVSVGGSVTGSSNKAVAVSISTSYQFVLMADGRLYVAAAGATSMTSTVTFNNSSSGGIVDIAMGRYYQYVLFGNGDLYGSLDGATSMTLVTSGVKMFDYENSYIYIYDGNMIKSATATGAGNHTWSDRLSSPRTDVVQIRGGSGWGFLTSSGTLYTMEGMPTTQWTGSNHTRSVTGVSYFDNTSGHSNWGYLKNGQIYLWATGGGYITSNTSPGALSGVSGLPTPDLGGLPSISSSPPAMHFSKKSKRSK